MLIDFSEQLYDQKGEPLRDRRSGELITLSFAAREALLAVPQGGSVAQSEKLERFDLAMRILKATEPLAVTVKEAALIDDTCEKWWGIYVYGLVHYILEGAAGGATEGSPGTG